MTKKTLPGKEELSFTIMHTNDEHSALIPFGPAVDYHPDRDNSSVGGFARLATLVKEVREEKRRAKEPFILVSAGDIIGSNPYSWLIYRGHSPELMIMNEIGFDLMAIGNHELHQGMDILTNYFKGAGYPSHHLNTNILGTNLIFSQDSPLAELGIVKQTLIKKLENGLTLGFFSLLGYDAIEVTEQTELPEFSFADPVSSARKAIAALRQQKADIIVAVNHSGVEINRKLAEKVSGIDIIIGGHEHIVLNEPLIVNGTFIVEAGESLTHAGILEFSYKRETGKLELKNDKTGRSYLTKIDNSIKADQEISRKVSEYTAMLNQLLKELSGGKIDNITKPILAIDYDLPYTPRREDHPAGNFATDAMRLMAEKKSGDKVDVAFQGTGLFRRDLLRGKNHEALNKVSFFDLAEILEITNGPDGEAGTPMVSFYLTGKELWYLCEICIFAAEAMTEHYSLQMSGVKFSYNRKSAALFRIPPSGFPFPSFRAVSEAFIYKGKGRQTENDNDYLPLNKKDKKLYHVVTDYLLAKHAVSYINKTIPFVNISLRDKRGNPLENAEKGIVMSEGKQYKIWEALYDHAVSFPKGANGLPALDDYYQKGRKRIMPLEDIKKTRPKWPLLLLATSSLAFYCFKQKLRKKNSLGENQ